MLWPFFFGIFSFKMPSHVVTGDTWPAEALSCAVLLSRLRVQFSRSPNLLPAPRSRSVHSLSSACIPRPLDVLFLLPEVLLAPEALGILILRYWSQDHRLGSSSYPRHVCNYSPTRSQAFNTSFVVRPERLQQSQTSAFQGYFSFSH